MDGGKLELWLWEIPDDRRPGKRRVTRYHMTEETARQRFGLEAVKVPGSLETREPSEQTGAFLKRS